MVERHHWEWLPCLLRAALLHRCMGIIREVPPWDIMRHRCISLTPSKSLQLEQQECQLSLSR